ncbi:MAG TPA: hypothetical protein H9883_04130 [Candidatus Ruthenibacterium merdigallinarum]|nr:hypothetical protein [Candidatus Ruthenibacterium merdigallinarum]
MESVTMRIMQNTPFLCAAHGGALRWKTGGMGNFKKLNFSYYSRETALVKPRGRKEGALCACAAGEKMARAA